MTSEPKGRGLDPQRVAHWRLRFVPPDTGDVQWFRGAKGLSRFLAPLRANSAEDDPDGFEAVLHARRIGSVALTNVLTTPCSVTTLHVSPQASPDAYLSLLICSCAGQVIASSDSPTETFRAGQLILLSSTTARTLSFEAVCECTWLRIPVSALGGEFTDAPDRVTSLMPDTALVRVVTTFIGRLAQATSSPTSAADADAAVNTLVGLVASLINQQLYRVHSVDYAAQTVRRRAHEVIDRDFGNPRFTAESLARELGLSRRQLYRHFTGSAVSLADMIASRRLSEVKSLLLAAPDIPMVDIARAAGFSSVSTMRHRFQTAFGCTPAEFRTNPGFGGRSPPSETPGEAVDLHGPAPYDE